MSGQGQLVVDGTHEFSQIRVLDASRAEVAFAVGRLDQRLDAGVYYVQSIVPGMKQERIVAVEPDATAVVDDFAPDFDSVAPLLQARSSHEYHVDPAVRLSNTPHVVRPGATSRAFFFGRMQDAQQTAEFIPAPFHLDAVNGEPLASSEMGASDPSWGWQALTVDIAAGTYVIREENKDIGLRAQALYCAPGWETQVFFDLGDSNPFASASVFMRRKGEGFSASMSGQDYERVDAALDGLAAGQIALTRQDIDGLLNGKFENPMLGLIGAHAYLMRTRRSGEEVDYGGLRHVSDNLQGLLGICPDVAVLRAVAESRGDEDYDAPGLTITEPPMLAAATRIALRLAARAAGIAPPGSPLSSIGGRLISGSAWTRWDLDATDDDVAGDLTVAIRQMLDADANVTAQQIATSLVVPRSLVDEYLGSQ